MKKDDAVDESFARARTLQKKTDWDYEMCLAIVRRNPNATIDDIITKRTPLSG